MASSEPRSVPVVRLAIFGVGRIGHAHFLNIIRARDRAELLYVVEEEVAKCRDMVNKYHVTSAVVLGPEDADRVYKDSRVDGIVVCTPTSTHAEIVQKALKHGKGVFCEKPLAASLEAIRSCYEASESAGKPLLCGFNRRFDPTNRALRERVLSGEIGDIHVVKTTSRGHPHPSLEYLKTSGGFFHDAVIHDIYVVCWLVGDFPQSVYVQGHAHNPDIAAISDIDTAAVVMNFQNGAIATIDASRYASYGYDQRLEVFGSRGQLRTDNQHVTSVHGYTRAGEQTDSYKFSLLERYAESYSKVIHHFLDVMQGSCDPEVTKQDIVNVFKITTACQKSCDRRQPFMIDYGEN